MDVALGIVLLVGFVIGYYWFRRGLSKAVGVGLNKTVFRAGVQRRSAFIDTSVLFKPSTTMDPDAIYAMAKKAIPFRSAASIAGVSVTLVGENANLAYIQLKNVVAGEVGSVTVSVEQFDKQPHARFTVTEWLVSDGDPRSGHFEKLQSEWLEALRRADPRGSVIRRSTKSLQPPGEAVPRAMTGESDGSTATGQQNGKAIGTRDDQPTPSSSSGAATHSSQASQTRPLEDAKEPTAGQLTPVHPVDHPSDGDLASGPVSSGTQTATAGSEAADQPSSLDPKAETARVASGKADTTESGLCPSCNAAIDTKRKFCRACGSRLPSVEPEVRQAKFCASCAYRFSGSQQYCTKCGEARRSRPAQTREQQRLGRHDDPPQGERPAAADPVAPRPEAVHADGDAGADKEQKPAAATADAAAVQVTASQTTQRHRPGANDGPQDVAQKRPRSAVDRPLICRVCGRELLPGSRFCSRCGKATQPS